MFFCGCTLIFIYLTINTYYEIGTIEHEGTHMIMVVKNDIFYVDISLKFTIMFTI